MPSKTSQPVQATTVAAPLGAPALLVSPAPQQDPAMPSSALPVQVDAGGILWLTQPNGERVPVTPVRAFALTAPDAGISLVGPDGRECFWVAALSAQSPEVRALLQAALAPRDFAPVLLQLRSVSTFSVPSVWDVHTDRGDTRFVLQAEEDIRRLDGGALLLTGAHGLQLRVPSRQALDRHSRRLLERFL